MFNPNYDDMNKNNAAGVLAHFGNEETMEIRNDNDVTVSQGAMAFELLSEPNQLDAPVASMTGQRFLGIIMNEQDGRQHDSSVKIMTRGSIYTICEADAPLTHGGPVYARIVADGAGKDVLGALRADADGGNAVLVPDAVCNQAPDAERKCIVKLLRNLA